MKNAQSCHCEAGQCRRGRINLPRNAVVGHFVDFDVARGAFSDGLSTFLETLSEVKKKSKMSFA